jgi:hypothetical protein
MAVHSQQQPGDVDCHLGVLGLGIPQSVFGLNFISCRFSRVAAPSQSYLVSVVRLDALSRLR